MTTENCHDKSNKRFNHLSDEELLKEILKELDKIEESDPVRYKKGMDRIYEIHMKY